jgi:hypothetical protein
MMPQPKRQITSVENWQAELSRLSRLIVQAVAHEC